jgi:hypothetical protein
MENSNPSIGDWIKVIFSLILSLIQYIFILEAWLSYILNSILKFLSAFFFPIALLSFLWWPLDMLCGVCWMTLDWIKYLMFNVEFTWKESAFRWTSHFPNL